MTSAFKLESERCLQVANGFLEQVEGGRRFFEPVDSELVTERSPLRWFLAPAVMFLLGALGCFFISFRWK